jgi:hypothetical protein
MKINVTNIQKRQRMCDKCRKTIAEFPEHFGNQVVVSSNSECDINKKEDLDSFKIKQVHFVSSFNKTVCVVHRRVTPFHQKKKK